MVTVKQLFRDQQEYVGKEIEVGGWVRTIRDSKVLGFIELNDGSFFKNLQVVFEDGVIDNFKEVCKINVGSAIVCRGTLVATPEARQSFELKAAEITLEGIAPGIIRCRRSGIPWSICAPSRICGPGRTLFPRCSG